MFLQYYVTESATGNRVNIEIDAATQADLDIVFSPMSDETMLLQRFRKRPCLCGSCRSKELWFETGICHRKSRIYCRTLLWDSPSGIRFSGSPAVENAPPKASNES